MYFTEVTHQTILNPNYLLYFNVHVASHQIDNYNPARAFVTIITTLLCIYQRYIKAKCRCRLVYTTLNCIIIFEARDMFHYRNPRNCLLYYAFLTIIICAIICRQHHHRHTLCLSLCLTYAEDVYR